MSGKGKSGGSDPDKKVSNFLTKVVIAGLVAAILLYLCARGRSIREQEDQSLVQVGQVLA